MSLFITVYLNIWQIFVTLFATVLRFDFLLLSLIQLTALFKMCIDAVQYVKSMCIFVEN